MTDRITRLRVRGFRCLADVTLDLSGLTVLIGENGSGKSSLVEVLETLRYFAEPGSSLQRYLFEHPSPVRSGASQFELEVQIEGDDASGEPKLIYCLSVQDDAGSSRISKEQLFVGPIGGSNELLRAIDRHVAFGIVFEPRLSQLTRVDVDPTKTLLSAYGNLPPISDLLALQHHSIHRAFRALNGIEIHVPFEVLPQWVAKRTGRRSACRETVSSQPGSRLELLGANLPNVYQSLKNDFGPEHWQETLGYIRLGLGSDVSDIIVKSDHSGAQHLLIRVDSLGAPIPASVASEGMLTYLALVALQRLPFTRSVLAFDEIERHLHPEWLVRVFSMFESISRECPVVITTHSDRILDWVEEPTKSVVLCELDGQRTTRLLRPDAELLRAWLKDYRGLGELRTAGLESAVMEVREGEE